MRQQWASLLGEIEPRNPKVQSQNSEFVSLVGADVRRLTLPNPESAIPDPNLDRASSRRLLQSKDAAANEAKAIKVERISLEPEPGIIVPLLLALPRAKSINPPVVIALSQQGKSRFLAERAETIAELLESGVAVCLPDVRGTGETSPGSSRGYRSEATSISASELMLGRTMLGTRLQDLRSVLCYLRMRGDLDTKRLALWGDSFVPANPSGLSDPLIDEGEAPHPSEPLGGLLALLGALYENDVRAVAASGMLAGYQTVLRDRFCYVPHDAIVPGALTVGDLADVAAALVPRPLRLARLVDGRNVLMTADGARPLLEPALKAYDGTKNELLLLPSSEKDLAAWLVQALLDKL